MNLLILFMILFVTWHILGTFCFGQVFLRKLLSSAGCGMKDEIEQEKNQKTGLIHVVSANGAYLLPVARGRSTCESLFVMS